MARRLFCYRRPSINTLLGITAAKKRLKRDLGITAAMKPFRWWGNEKRKAKRRLGYYSPLGRILRLGLPRFTLTSAAPSAKPRRGIIEAFAAAVGTLIVTMAVGVFGVFAIVAGAVALSIGGCSPSSTTPTQPARLASVETPSTSPPVEQAAVTPIDVPAPSRPMGSSSSSGEPSPAKPRPPLASDDFIEPTSPARAPVRTWADRDGSHHIVATFVDVEGSKVRLRKENGKEVTVPVSKLSDDDFAYLPTVGARDHYPRKIVGKVVGVTDGDTLVIVDAEHHQHKIRLNAIDAPEKRQDYGTKAREALAHKVFEKTVTIEWRELDKYGRTIGDIFLDDRWINKEMIQDGWAWHYVKYSDSEDLAAAELAARKTRAGLWASADREPPWEFRHREKAIAAVDPPKRQSKAEPPTPARDPTPAYVPSSSEKTVHVRGYTKKDGTYVAPHDRSAPHRRK